MSVEERQIDWAQCPIGRRCEMKVDFLSKAHDDTKEKQEKILQKVDMIHEQTSKLSGKLTIMASIFLLMAAAGISLLFDIFKDILHKLGGVG